MKVKVCGMRDADNIREVEALGIDMMGFIFWPKSSRYVSERPNYMPTKCKRVGVFVDEDIEQVKRTADEYQLDMIQLHGHERPDYIRQLSGRKVIKAFNIATSADLEATKPYEDIVDYFLFDTKGKSVGGNGAKFDWTVLADYVGETPFLLSGGIGPDDAARIRSFHHSQLAGIDLNSRFEITPGLKDINKLKEFIKELQL
ncbi:MAG: phosphoribosylanthranilate isomerase [Prevotella sp.]|nr:phosphoribosylanthranilate isomerase [Prevotella sp.]